MPSVTYEIWYFSVRTNVCNRLAESTNQFIDVIKTVRELC